MTHSRSLSEKFPSYRQEACTTENVIQCLSIRERKKERLWVEGRIYENKQVRRRGHSKNQGISSQKGGEIWLYKQNQHHNSTKFN